MEGVFFSYSHLWISFTKRTAHTHTHTLQQHITQKRTKQPDIYTVSTWIINLSNPLGSSGITSESWMEIHNVLAGSMSPGESLEGKSPNRQSNMIYNFQKDKGEWNFSKKKKRKGKKKTLKKLSTNRTNWKPILDVNNYGLINTRLLFTPRVQQRFMTSQRVKSLTVYWSADSDRTRDVQKTLSEVGALKLLKEIL